MKKDNITIKPSFGDEAGYDTVLDGSSNNNPNITEGKKKFIFSATGNIMISTTEDSSADIDQSVRGVFNEVSVFFAAMTKAISTTKRPGNDDNYTLYDYTALEKVIDGSGCFIHCTQEDIKYTSNSFGADFSKELISALLGLPKGGGSLAFAQAMLASMGKEAVKIAGDKSTDENRIGNIVFVCELLFGMPIISAIVVYVDNKIAKTTFEAGPCVHIESQQITMEMHKGVYMFVTPAFIRKYSDDFNSITESDGYGKYVAYLQSLLTSSIVVSSLQIKNGATVTDGKLKVNQSYTLVGNSFGTNEGTITIGGKKANISNWSNTTIDITFNDAVETASPLVITDAANNTVSYGAFTIDAQE